MLDRDEGSQTKVFCALSEHAGLDADHLVDTAARYFALVQQGQVLFAAALINHCPSTGCQHSNPGFRKMISTVSASIPGMIWDSCSFDVVFGADGTVASGSVREPVTGEFFFSVLAPREVCSVFEGSVYPDRSSLAGVPPPLAA